MYLWSDTAQLKRLTNKAFNQSFIQFVIIFILYIYGYHVLFSIIISFKSIGLFFSIYLSFYKSKWNFCVKCLTYKCLAFYLFLQEFYRLGIRKYLCMNQHIGISLNIYLSIYIMHIFLPFCLSIFIFVWMHLSIITI